ncbi:hypothetical protein JVU11DRAFT_3803 [Chiua virens]|nr:hypothetical protein JVU11DRAFT_3803 [Chiua virens]
MLVCPFRFFPVSFLIHTPSALWHPSMWGFNVTAQTFDYDNRPVVPLANMPFSKWWFHNHLSYPPHPDDVFELSAGQNVTMQIACNKGDTTFYASSEGGNTQQSGDPNDVCPGSPMSAYHTTGINDVKGCALAIAYKSDASQVQPADFTVFSVNHTCVWNRYTDFGVPQKMPPCENGKCICSFFWIHSADSGSEQMYMNAFQCNVSNSISTVGLATPSVARRCGADPANGRQDPVPGNCTWGAKQPLYWFQAEQNNMFEGTYSPPFYNDLYNFADGAQNDIFQDSYQNIPVPGPNQTALPVLATPGAVAAAAAAAAGNGTTTPLPTSTSAVEGSPSAILPSHVPLSAAPLSAAPLSAAPSATPSNSNSKCKRKRSTPSDSSRRQAPAERAIEASFARKAVDRHRRTLNMKKRSDIWKPI